MTESPDERVERLARAVAMAGSMGPKLFGPESDGDDEAEQYRVGARQIARAVIASDREAGMVTVPREPTAAMMHAGGMALETGVRMEGPNPASRQKAARVYEATIAAHEQED